MVVNWTIRLLGFGAAGLALCLAQPVQAGCTVIAATNSGPTKASALAASQAAVGQQLQPRPST